MFKSFYIPRHISLIHDLGRDDGATRAWHVRCKICGVKEFILSRCSNKEEERLYMERRVGFFVLAHQRHRSE